MPVQSSQSVLKQVSPEKFSIIHFSEFTDSQQELEIDSASILVIDQHNTCSSICLFLY